MHTPIYICCLAWQKKSRRTLTLDRGRGSGLSLTGLGSDPREKYESGSKLREKFGSKPPKKLIKIRPINIKFLLQCLIKLSKNLRYSFVVSSVLCNKNNEKNVSKILYPDPGVQMVSNQNSRVQIHNPALEGRAVVQTSAQGRAVYNVQVLWIRMHFFYLGSGPNFSNKLETDPTIPTSIKKTIILYWFFFL